MSTKHQSQHQSHKDHHSGKTAHVPTKKDHKAEHNKITEKSDEQPEGAETGEAASEDAPTPPETVEQKKAVEGLQKVKMRFSEHKFYNDQNVPMFMAGEIYEIEGAEWIARWLKRGGEIIEEVKVDHKSKHKAGKVESDEEVDL